MTPYSCSSERVALLRWTAAVGAVTADAVADLDDVSIASARSRLGRLTRERLLARHRLLVGDPPLYTITRAGLRQADLDSLEPSRVSVANAPHTLACARAAAALQRCYPDHDVIGERALRDRERSAGAPLASAILAPGAGEPRLHRPDLVLWPPDAGRLPVSVELELTVKAPRRLAEICRAWARAREVAGVLYLAPAPVRKALERAIGLAGTERIIVLPLDSLALGDRLGSTARTVSSDPYVGGRGSTNERTESRCRPFRSIELS